MVVTFGDEVHSQVDTSLRPELVEIVGTVTAVLAEFHLRQQYQPVDPQASKLESAFLERHARRASGTEPVIDAQAMAAIESSDMAILGEAPDGTLLTWNGTAERIFGYAGREIIGQGHTRLVPEFLKHEDTELVERVRNGETILNRETVRQHHDGRLIDVSLSLLPVVRSGTLLGLCSVIRDITERKRVERALAERERGQRERLAQFRSIFEALPVAVWIALDPECRFVTGNTAAYELFRLPRGGDSRSQSEAEGIRPFRVFHNGVEAGSHDLPLKMAASQGIEVRDYQQDVVFDDGTLRRLLGGATPIRAESGDIRGAIAAFLDITARTEKVEDFRRLAYFDALTELPNRALLMDRIQRAFAVSQRNHSRTAVIFVDLDNFKDLNDRLGHQAGDSALKQVAERIRPTLRVIDTVSRFGGDEFVIVLPQLRHPNDACAVARKLCQQLNTGIMVHGQDVRVTCSLGISIFPDHGSSPAELIRFADQAMYRAKQQGGNTYKLFETVL